MPRSVSRLAVPLRTVRCTPFAVPDGGDGESAAAGSILNVASLSAGFESVWRARAEAVIATGPGPVTVTARRTVPGGPRKSRSQTKGGPATQPGPRSDAEPEMVTFADGETVTSDTLRESALVRHGERQVETVANLDAPRGSGPGRDEVGATAATGGGRWVAGGGGGGASGTKW